MMDRPGVGVGVYVRKDGKVLMGRRKGSYGADMWCSPGGHLEKNESLEDCARREVHEETGVDIDNIRFVTATNDIDSQNKSHYVTLVFVADWKSGEARLVEPDKFYEWRWYVWDMLPKPLLLSCRNFLQTGYNPLNL